MRYIPSWVPATLMLQAVLFGVLARRGVPLVLSALVSCCFGVAIRFFQLLLAEEERQGGTWIHLLDIRMWTPRHRGDLVRSGMASACLTVLFLLAGWLTNTL